MAAPRIHAYRVLLAIREHPAISIGALGEALGTNQVS